MKKIFPLIFFFFSFIISFAQDNEKLKQLITEGIELHDKGDYKGAIKKYNEALVIDKNNYNANYEKSFSYYAAKMYDECITISIFIIEQLPETFEKANVYSNYGSALDDKGDKQQAIEIFNDGIKKYPYNYRLHFNKGLTLMRLNKQDEALLSFQKTLEVKPLHPSANFYTGAILQTSNKIPALLATLVFLIIESQTDRTKIALERMQQIMFGNVKKDGDNKTTITINSALFDDKNKNSENNFNSVEMMMSLLFVSTNDKKLEALDDAEKLSLQLQLLISSLGENKKKSTGFYWKFYVPFFIALKEKDYTSTFAHIIFAGKNDATINKWLTDNKDKVDEFYFWLQNYKWDRF